MSALMIARIAVKDADKFQTYLAKTREVATPFGAEMVFRGAVQAALTGDVDHQVVVVVRFPSVEAIDEWYRSDAYQPLIPLREAAADMEMTSYQVVA